MKFWDIKNLKKNLINNYVIIYEKMIRENSYNIMLLVKFKVNFENDKKKDMLMRVMIKSKQMKKYLTFHKNFDEKNKPQ